MGAVVMRRGDSGFAVGHNYTSQWRALLANGGLIDSC